MRWFEGVKDVFENINRSVLLGVGLVIVAVLVAATFVVGDTDQVAEENNNQAETQQESTEPEQESSGEESGTEEGADQESSSDQNGDGEASPQNGEPRVSSETDENNEQTANNGEQAPEQLADTGPVSAAAALALGTGGYIYHRSRKNLGARRQD
ncbi:hypothetical protein BRC19_00440 [Candidatus Saccharibacteria bacterium QS_5_54_17]|nr:MAG: hypothetical protein BRC19_00440 [Candidatus Saccharibacteria bacterium QS_5_54_17]